jgi:hypothetical protein
MRCDTCGGSDFYEDRQSMMVCATCGSMSQEHFAESFETETFLDRRSIRVIRSKARSADSGSTKEKADVRCLLSAYQSCLRGFAEVCA